MLAAAPATDPRAPTTLLAFSDTVLDLVVTDMSIVYDPFNARGTG